MSRNPLDPVRLRERLAAKHGIHPPRDIRDYPYARTVHGLTPDWLGYRRHVRVYHALLRAAAAATGDDYALSVIRDPMTHQRKGYAVHTKSQQISDEIAATIQRLVL